VADIVALVFVLAGVFLYLNGVLGEPLSKIETVEVEEVLTESPRLGPWWPSGILKLKSNNSEFSGKYVLVDQQRLQTLFPGTSITLPVHQGAFGVPWVELEGIRPDVRESVAKLIGEREKDSLLIKWAIQNELSARRFRQAVTMAATYFEQEPGDFYFAFTLAEGAVQNRNPAIAVQLLKPFVKRHYNYRLYSLFGYYLRISDDAVGSVDYLKAAVGIDPEEPEAYYLLGYTLKNQGYKDEALATFTKLIQLQPQYASMLEVALRDLNDVHIK
jgi:tetratricopeptide (TPR) repeat protein